MMNSKRNQTIAIARFLMYKHNLNQQLEGMTGRGISGRPYRAGCGQLCKGFDAGTARKNVVGFRSWSIRTRFLRRLGRGLSLCDCVYAL